MGRFQLESIYLYFPPSSQLLYNLSLEVLFESPTSLALRLETMLYVTGKLLIVTFHIEFSLKFKYKYFASYLQDGDNSLS